MWGFVIGAVAFIFGYHVGKSKKHRKKKDRHSPNTIREPPKELVPVWKPPKEFVTGGAVSTRTVWMPPLS